MGVVAKMFISTVSESPDRDHTKTYNLGVVCRGELNKDWAAATPSGNMKCGEFPVLAEVWASEGPFEIEVLQTPDPDGDWIFDKCDWSYGGCQVHFRQKEKPWGELNLTINATAATKVMRDAYAKSLTDGGEPSRWKIIFRIPQ